MALAMIPLPALLLCTIFLMLSAVHVYWLIGDFSGLEGVVPSRDGKALFQPGKISTLAVAVALFLAAVIALWRGSSSPIGPAWAPRIGIWVVAAVFAVRAIGDFRYVGLFKRVRDTRFARNDSLFFSPLCLVIAAMAVWLAVGY